MAHRGDPAEAIDADSLRSYWDGEASTYDVHPTHRLSNRVTMAAWDAALTSALPQPPARILDIGAGTGFLSLRLARLGFNVTAMDFSPSMMEALTVNSRIAGLRIDSVVGDAVRPPSGPFDAVVERNLLWTLPDPVTALRAWRSVTPGGRIAVFGAIWGPGADRVERVRQVLRRAGAVLQRRNGHHRPMSPKLFSTLPFGDGVSPDTVLRLLEDAGWVNPCLVRLRDVEWAERAQEVATFMQLLGPIPRYVISASAGKP